MSYTRTLELQHNEVPAIVNVETGEFNTLEPPKQKIPKDSKVMYFKHDQPFQRRFYKAWDLLETQTTELEYKAAEKMSRMAQAYTNSLAPLCPESTVREIAETLKIDKNKVTKVVDKLFKLGVIAKFEVYERYEQHHNYWILNPYLVYNGRTIPKDVAGLFEGTWYANL